MLRRLFLLVSTVAAAAAGLFLWTRRDELGAEVERIRGERRAGLRSAPSARHGAPLHPRGEGAAAPAPGATTGASRVNGHDAVEARVTPLDRKAAPAEPKALGTELHTTEAVTSGAAAAGAAEVAATEELASVAEAPQCQAHTKSGKRCARDAEPGSDRCWQHDPS